MLRKILACVLTFAILFGNIVLLNNVKKDSNEILTTTNERFVTSEVEVDGSNVKCSYEKDTDNYYLYLDDVEYELNVDMYDGCAMVYMSHESSTTNTNEFIAQSATALTLTAAYWSPKIIAAAKVVISSVIKITLAVAAYYSAELIATTINDVKIGELTKRDLKTKAKTATKAIDLIKTAKRDNNAYYYEAYLYKNQVMIGRQISFYEAVKRLENGCDVFASNLNAALGAAKKASTIGQVKFDPYHRGKGFMFPHYHPRGRTWIKDSTSMPHCWFPPKI